MKPYEMGQFLEPKFYEYLKVFMVIKGVGFTWLKELQNSFNISSPVAAEAIKILEREGYIISKDFWKLPLDISEIIRITNAGYFDSHRTYPKVYMVTPNEDPQEWVNLFKDEIDKAYRFSESYRQTMDLIKQKEEVIKKFLFKFNEIEQNEDERIRIADGGVRYITTTIKAKKEEARKLKNKEDALNAMEELQQEGFFGKNKQLSASVKNELTILNNQISPVSTNTQLCIYSVKGKNSSSEEFNLSMKAVEKQYKLDKLNDKEMEHVEDIKDNIQKVQRSNNKSDKKFWELKDLPQIPGYGKSIEQLEKEYVKGTFDFYEDLLDLPGYNKRKKDLFTEFDIQNLIKQLKTTGKLDMFEAQATCKSKENFFEFQKLIKDLNVTFDGDNFIFKK